MSARQTIASTELISEDVNEQATGVVKSAIDPATIAAFAALGAQALQFAGKLVGGKTGDALSDIANEINGVGYKIQNVARQLEGLLTGVQQVIESQDKEQLAKVWPVHTQVMSYRAAFPQGVPTLADTNNPNYVEANGRSSESLFYFQGLPRSPLTFMPSLCHVTNTRMEVAVNTWPCWFQQNRPEQPKYTNELNLSSGCLNTSVSAGGASLDKMVVIKPIKGKLFGPDEPLDPRGTIGYQVVDTDENKVIFSKKGEDLKSIHKEAGQVAAQRRSQKRQQTLGDFQKTGGAWTNMVARLAPAGIQRALNLGDAGQFLSYVNARTLVMKSAVDLDQESDGNGSVYQPLPMRDILLDVLTSAPMKERHGLLATGADRRSVSFWFEKTFHREPSPEELKTLLQVVNIFGHDSFFGCLAYSHEYGERYGTGAPEGFVRADEIPAAERKR